MICYNETKEERSVKDEISTMKVKIIMKIGWGGGLYEGHRTGTLHQGIWTIRIID